MMEIDRVSISDKNNNLLYYPFANTQFEMPTRGRYPAEYPIGALIHYTAGRSERGYIDAKNTVHFGSRMGYCYFCISSDGEVFQTAPLNRWGYHAGRSSHPSIGTELSNKLVGIEVCCAGKLRQSGESYYSWFNSEYSESDVRNVTEDTRYPNSGIYHKFTLQQEEALTNLLLWIRRNNPIIFNFDYVLGHDEVSNIKTDPGGSLSYPMNAYREYLKDRFSNSLDSRSSL